MGDDFAVRVSAGSRRAEAPTFELPHAWTDAGIAVEALGTGAHLLHTAVAVCVLNDVLREARSHGLAVDGVVVSARGEFSDDWSSTGITYDVTLDSGADDALLSALLARVDEVAEIPRAVRAGVPVNREAVYG